MTIPPYPLQLFDHPTAIVGTTGSGKTYAAKGAVEKLLGEGRRVIIIDPTGAWFGLRSSRDGDGDGFPVMIFGGDHADVDITPDSETGKALALELATRDVQAIIDISAMTGGEKNRFLTPFLEHLYANNKAALHLIVDEADEIAAQRLADGEQRLFGIFDKIVRRGRIKGFRPLMITQRPAVIHKNVLSQIGTLIALKLTSPQDRKAVEDWVKGNADADQAKEVMTSLPRLSRGEGWIWSPADDVLERITFPEITTFDSSRTPEIGEVVTAPALAAVDVAALRDALRKDSEDEATQAGPSGGDLKVAEQRGYEKGLEEGYRRGTSALIELMGWTIEEIGSFKASIEAKFEEMSLGELGQEVARRRDAGSPSGKAADFDSAIVGSNPAPATTASDLSPSARKIINAVQAVYPMGITLKVAAKRAGLSSRSSAYRKHIADAGSSPLITDRGDGRFVALQEHMPDGPIHVVGLEAFKAKLPPSYANMLSTIEAANGRPLSREEVADGAGVSSTSSGLGSGLRELLALDLIEQRDGGYAISSDFLKEDLH